MDREPIGSTCIASMGFEVAFNIETPLALGDIPGTLEIEFVKGGVYVFEGVPTSVYKELYRRRLWASVGRYYNQVIKDGYGGYRVE